MRTHPLSCALLVILTASSPALNLLGAQGAGGVEPAAPGDTATSQPAGRPTVTVMDFDHGTVASQIAGDRGTRRRLERMGITDANALASALGVGAADLIVEQLVASQAYRVLERKQLAAVRYEQELAAGGGSAAAPARTAARYLVTGSITRLGFEEKRLGGALGAVASVGLYGLGAKKNRTEVHLTARLIDTQTGDIVAAFTGEGESDRGWGLTVFGMGSGGFGGFSGGSSNIRETAIGEATADAARRVVEQMLIASGRRAAGGGAP